MTYYDTTNLNPKERAKRREQCQCQEDVVLTFFRENGGSHPPSKVWTKCFDRDKTPLTSVRRAITNLEHRGHLIKTDVKVEGEYKAPEHLWRLV